MSQASALATAIGVQALRSEGTVTPVVPATQTQYPAIGDTLQVLHASEEGADGLTRIVRAGSEHRVVAAVLMSDSHGYNVRDNAGDVWTVKRGAKADWETVYVRYQ